MQPKNILLLLPRQALDYGEQSNLIQRGVELSRKYAAHLHLLQVLDTPPQLHSAFETSAYQKSVSSNALDLEKQKLKRLEGQLDQYDNLNFSCHCEYGVPRTDFAIAFADEIEADLILKQSRDERYVLGIFDNTDWELLREAKCPIWLACGNEGPARGVVAAIECRLDNEEGSSERYALDNMVFAIAKSISYQYSAPLYLVHAYDVPRSESYLDYTPFIPSEPMSPSIVAQLQEDKEEERQRIAKLHGHAIRTFVDEHGIPLDDVDVCEGIPADIIQNKAADHGAGLIVMGASGDRSRWDRVFQNVTAEPTLDRAPCDILFVH